MGFRQNPQVGSPQLGPTGSAGGMPKRPVVMTGLMPWLKQAQPAPMGNPMSPAYGTPPQASPTQPWYAQQMAQRNQVMQQQFQAADLQRQQALAAALRQQRQQQRQSAVQDRAFQMSGGAGAAGSD